MTLLHESDEISGQGLAVYANLPLPHWWVQPSLLYMTNRSYLNSSPHVQMFLGQTELFPYIFIIRSFIETLLRIIHKQHQGPISL